MKNFRNITINSSILFVIATILQMTFHECGHFVAAILVHAKNIGLYHNYVAASNANSPLPVTKTIFYTGAGPLISLSIGVFFHFVCSRQRKRNMLFLFNLYLSVFGYIAFFGYLIIAPFFTYGDTGYIFQALGFPIWLTVSIAVTGGIILYAIMCKLTRYFVEMGTNEIISDKNLRPEFMCYLIKYPLYIGIVITTLLNLPTSTVLSLICPLCSPFCIMWVYRKTTSKQYPKEKMSTDLSYINKIQPVWIAVLFLVIIMNRLLVYGIVVN